VNPSVPANTRSNPIRAGSVRIEKPLDCAAEGGGVSPADGLAWRGFIDSISTTPATSAAYACANTRRQRKAYVLFADRGFLCRHPAIADRRLLDICEIRLVPRVHALTNLVLSELIDSGNQMLVTRRFDAKAREQGQG
jgi:hypothetical protein